MMLMSYNSVVGKISLEVGSFCFASRIAKTYENLLLLGEQKTRSLMGKNAFLNHTKILSTVGLYPLGEESVEIVRGFYGKQVLDLLGCRVTSVNTVEDYPIGTSFIVRQIVYDNEGLLLNLDVLLDGNVIDIVGPFDSKQFVDLFTLS